jgi:hypothetical protein
MIMVIEQAVGVTKPAIFSNNLTEEFKEGLAVFVIFKDALPGVTPRGKVINGPREFNA